MQTAVCIINYNAYNDTLACVQSLWNEACDIVVIDNGSKNDAVEHLRQQWQADASEWCYQDGSFLPVTTPEAPRLHFILSEKNGGFAYGNNVLQQFVKQYLDSSAVLWLNNDTEVPEGFVSTLEHEYARYQVPTAIAAEERNFYTKQRRHSGMHFLNLPTGLAFTHRLPLSHAYLCGACIMTSVDAPEWNEDYFLYFEDADYAIRLREKGYQLVTTDKTHYFHKQGVSTGGNREVVLKSMWHFYTLHFPRYKRLVRIIRSIQYRVCGNKEAYFSLNRYYESSR